MEMKRRLSSSQVVNELVGCIISGPVPVSQHDLSYNAICIDNIKCNISFKRSLQDIRKLNNF